jgi:hypothetical protein
MTGLLGCDALACIIVVGEGLCHGLGLCLSAASSSTCTQQVNKRFWFGTGIAVYDRAKFVCAQD